MDEQTMQAAAQAGLTAQAEHEVLIAAPPDAVWQALTADIGRWWSHSFTDNPHAIALEARIGGHFYEAFDASGNGALFATVTFCQPPQKLKFIGTMGMDNPVLNQSEFELIEQDGGTLLKQTMTVFGVVPPQQALGYSKGWQMLLGQLKAYIEDGATVQWGEQQ